MAAEGGLRPYLPDEKRLIHPNRHDKDSSSLVDLVGVTRAAMQRVASLGSVRDIIACSAHPCCRKEGLLEPIQHLHLHSANDPILKLDEGLNATHDADLVVRCRRVVLGSLLARLNHLGPDHASRDTARS